VQVFPLMLNLSRFTSRNRSSADVEYRPKRVRKWLGGLPEDDPEHTVGEILAAIGKLNAAEVPADTRQQLLDTYRSSVNGIFEDFETDTSRDGTSHSQLPHQLPTDVGELISALADGYKLIALHGHAEGGNASRDRRYLSAIYCAMEQTVFAVLHAFRTRAPIPNGAHNDLHRLYRLAEEHKALYTPVTVAGKPAPFKSVGALYKQFLLVCIADPHHLGPGEMLDLFRFLARYTKATRLTRNGICDPPEGRFLVDLGGDGPPTACARSDGAPAPKDPVILDTTQVISVAVRDQINEEVSQEHRLLAEHGRHMLSHIVPHFRGIQLRRSGRQAVAQTVRITVGVEAVHHHLRNESQRPLEEVREGGSEETGAGPDTPDLGTCTVDDEGPGGWRLRGPRRTLAGSRIGDVVGMARSPVQDGSAPLALAMIQWMRGQGEDDLLLGLKTIDAPAVPVTCRPTTDGPDRGKAVLALMLSDTQDRQTPAALLVRKGIYAPDKMLRLDYEDRTDLVQMSELVMESPCLDHFRLNPHATED